MAGECFEDCHYYKALKTFKILTNKKLDLFNNLQSILGNLLAMEVNLDPLNIPNWTSTINRVMLEKSLMMQLKPKRNASKILIPLKKQSKMAVISAKKGVKRAKMAKIKSYYLRRSRNKKY